jgi:hypothetical protein
MIFLAALFFAIALIFDLTGFAHGHIDPTTFALAGLLCLALSFCPWGWLPVSRRRDGT